MRSFAVNEQIVIFWKSHSNVADISYFGCVQESWSQKAMGNHSQLQPFRGKPRRLGRLRQEHLSSTK